MDVGNGDAGVGHEPPVEDDGDEGGDDDGEEEHPPPLPPRPAAVELSDRPRGRMQSPPTTAVSSANVQTVSFLDGTRGTFVAPGTEAAAGGGSDDKVAALVSTTRVGSSALSDVAESTSLRSAAPTSLSRPRDDLESQLLVGDGMSESSMAWQLLRSQSGTRPPFEAADAGAEADKTLWDFATEFDDIPADTDPDWTDWDRLKAWKSKLKHYMILSSAGKPVYSRHGDLALINSSMGVVQTLISFYQAARNPLLGFTAGKTRFVVLTEGPLYLVAISSLGESDSQLRAQLEALYMQILSTLTLPTLTRIFVNRPSSDLRKPLQGAETLLSSLADSFTRGSPSALLGALECLRLRKSHRHSINNTFLKTRANSLLYGLIVAGGKLVSVIRPRKHSLHPGDLQLIFNMLFQSASVKSGGGDNWIPLCLPAFNNQGYLYMYVSFLNAGSDGDGDGDGDGGDGDGGGGGDGDGGGDGGGDGDGGGGGDGGAGGEGGEEEIAIILISVDKESFFVLQQMKDDVVAELDRNGSLEIIRTAARRGRATVAEVVGGAPISHFLFKSKANVQFCMPSLDLIFSDLVPRRRLMSLYHSMHAAMHARHSRLQTLHGAAHDSTSLACTTPVAELYCVAGPGVTRQAMVQAANRVMQWAKREEERLFIIGGAVF